MSYINIGRLAFPIMVLILVAQSFYVTKTILSIACMVTSFIPAAIGAISWRNRRGY